MTAETDLVRPEIRRIAPYNSGLTIEALRKRYAVETIAKLGSNENPLGASRAALDMGPALADLVRLYPDPGGSALCAALARRHGVAPDQIILGNGSEDLIAVLCRTVVRPGDRVGTLYPSFPLHEDYAVLMGGVIERVGVGPGLEIDADALGQLAASGPRMIMFSNPMNPVGSWLTPSGMEALVGGVRTGTLLVVDEAYAEYAEGEDFPDTLGLLKATDRDWVVLRTFSKAFGLAGLRIGYGIVSDPALVGFLDRARTPFNTNAIAQFAALAALNDAGHLRRSVELARSERDRIAGVLSAMGYAPVPSKGNFVFFDTGTDALEISEALLAHGVIVKPWRQPGYSQFLRVSAGSPPENDQFLDALRAITGRRA